VLWCCDAVIQESGAISASTAFDDRSQRAVDPSLSGAAVNTQSSCGCPEQTGLGADQIEQIISTKLAAVMAESTASVDGKLADLQSSMSQLVMAELAKKQQDTQAQQLADETVDTDRYAQLVCCLVLLLFFIHFSML